jgi:superfamily II RNA helicase
MLPLEKALVESLFQDNLLRVVFATETLAAGMVPSYHPSPQVWCLVITPRRRYGA